MHLETLLPKIPDAAKDLRLNLGSLLQSESLGPSQVRGTILASALATGQADLIRWAAAEARPVMEPAAFDAARTAAALMGMNNVFYRARHLLHDAELDRVPARLRMQGLASHGAPQADFELWCTAVSAIHGCGACLQAHAAKLKSQGVAVQALHDALRIAAVVAGAARTIEAESALA